MNRQQAELYQRIQTFSLDETDTASLDETDTALPFSHRLARENGWSLEYTSRVIEEYKKFVFLAAISDHPVTPSDQVDQVWHLHLLYTRSYWEEFCPKVLQKPLHHGPTKGGTWGRQKFNDWYNKTLKSYEQFFNQPPPSDIWHPAHIRFGRDTRFTRVNTEQNWIIPKPDCQWIATLYANPFMIVGLVWIMVFSGVAWAVAAPPIQASSHWLNPFRYAVPDFFFFCLLVGVTGFVMVRVLEWRLWRMNEHSFIPPMVMAGFCLVPFGLGMGKLIVELSNLVAWEFLSLFLLYRLWLEGCWIRRFSGVSGVSYAGWGKRLLKSHSWRLGEVC
ncbi:glycine-rich domain-containing protein [Leptothermofonsia sp. ETS-13]|uniref:glycine-rich domain-containing protein n=1 Tax=Leptothermofonsia sp. ETS-13 TaxID=3035696 RepID=UPI003B9F261E